MQKILAEAKKKNIQCSRVDGGNNLMVVFLHFNWSQLVSSDALKHPYQVCNRQGFR